MLRIKHKEEMSVDFRLRGNDGQELTEVDENITLP